MSRIIGAKNYNPGPVVNKILLCLNPGCQGAKHNADGTVEIVKFGQLHYQHAPLPECPYCGVVMTLDSMHARKSGHHSKSDEHKLKDKILEQVFTDAEKNGHQLAENSRQGDVGQANPDARRAQEYMNTMAKVQGHNLPVGWASVNGVKDVGKGFAIETRQQGAALPMNALSSSLGNHSFWRSRNNPKVKVG